MSIGNGNKRWFLRPTAVLCHRTAVSKTAPRWHVHRIRGVARDQNSFGVRPAVFVQRRNRRQQGRRIGMQWVFKQAPAVRVFNDLAHIHNSDAFTHVLNNTQIMAVSEMKMAAKGMEDPATTWNSLRQMGGEATGVTLLSPP